MKNICFITNFYKTDVILVIVKALRKLYSTIVNVSPNNNQYENLFIWFIDKLEGIDFKKFINGLIYNTFQCIMPFTYSDPRRVLRGNINLLSSAFLTIKNA